MPHAQIQRPAPQATGPAKQSAPSPQRTLAAQGYQAQREALRPTQNPQSGPQSGPQALPELQQMSTAVRTPAKGQAFVKGDGDKFSIDPNDVFQGALGDCYLMAALAAVAKTDPLKIANMVRDNQNGTYTVTFHLDRMLSSVRGREVRDVVVKPEFIYNGAAPMYAKEGDRDANSGKVELWVMLVEKAWAQIKGSYKAIEGGDPGEAMAMITGEESDSFTPADEADGGLERIGKALTDRHPVTAYTGKRDDWTKEQAAIAAERVIYGHHAYTVMSTAGGTFELRNPWGSDHPKALTPAQFKKLYVRASINRA